MAIVSGPVVNPGLRALRGSAAEAVLARSSLRAFLAGEVLLSEGQPVTDLMVVQEGEFIASVSGQSARAIEVFRYRPGDVFGEMSFLTGSPASATVRAAAPGVVLAIPYTVLDAAIHDLPEIATELGGLVAGRLALQNQKLREDTRGREVWMRCAPGLADAAGGALARSCAFHLNRPVAVLAARDSLPAAALRSGNARTPVSWVPLEPGADAVRIARDLTAANALVLVYVPRPPGSDAVALDIVEGHEPRNVSAAHVALVRSAGANPEELAAAGRGAGVTIVGAIPREHLAAANLSAPLSIANSLDEPWRSIGRVARWVTGQQVGLALGAGVAKGYAHVGVLEELERLRVPIDFVAGSSIGSAVAAGVASWRPPEFIRNEQDHPPARAPRRRHARGR